MPTTSATWVQLSAPRSYVGRVSFDLNLTPRVFLRVLRFSFLIKIDSHSITSGRGRIPSIGIASGIRPFHYGVQGWRSGESTRLPPMWPGFDSQTRRHMWVEFVVLHSAPRGFLRVFSGYSGFPSGFPSPKKNQNLFCFALLISI